MRKNFIVVNEEFVCAKCGHKNPLLAGSCRNHCRKCLYSMHVDDAVPGDRASSCGGLMIPFSLDYSGKKGYSVVHECVKCGKRMNNRTADDDDRDFLVRLSTIVP